MQPTKFRQYVPYITETTNILKNPGYSRHEEEPHFACLTRSNPRNDDACSSDIM